MRGQVSRKHERLSCMPRRHAAQAGTELAAPADQAFPVAPEELDAIEAYLMPQIIDLLRAGESRVTDSEAPQCGGNIGPWTGLEDGRHEILAEEPA